MNILWFDCETVGLNGPILRLQYAINDGPIHFIDYPFSNQTENHELSRWFQDPKTLLVAYNASFDVYHLYRWMHETFYKLPLSSESRPVKPMNCRVLDLQIPAMLEGPFKAFAFSKGKARSAARVRRVPRIVKDKVKKKILDVLQPHIPAEFKLTIGEHQCKGQPDLVTLSFSIDGRASLKAHARFYGAPTLSLPDFWPLPDRAIEKPWLPYYEEKDYEETKQKCIQTLRSPGSPFHTYCRLDIHFLRLLASELCSRTGRTVEQLVDHHSDCVHAVAYTRYFGFSFDHEKLLKTEKYYAQCVSASQEAIKGTDLKSSKQRLALLRSVDPLVGASNRRVLETLSQSDRPSSGVAQSMLNFGKYKQRLLQVQKVLESATGRAHPDLRVMGTATGRMSGTSGLNWQGIAQTEKDNEGEEVGLRACIETGFGGDFEALEVGIAAAAYRDAQLQADLDEGVDFHSMTASFLPKAVKGKITYEQIVEGYKAKDPAMSSLRKVGKACNFSVIYGAQEKKVAEIIGGTEAESRLFLGRFFERYTGLACFRKNAERMFCTADTDHWSPSSVKNMSSEIVDLLGFTRRFDFEKSVAMELWKLASLNNLTGVQGSIVRSIEKGRQTIDGAVKSALLGGAISIQQSVYRQACNSPVQSTGANLCKILAARLWDKLRINLLVIHDECISSFPLTNQVNEITKGFLREFQKDVKSLNIEMKKINYWSEK